MLLHRRQCFNTDSAPVESNRDEAGNTKLYLSCYEKNTIMQLIHLFPDLCRDLNNTEPAKYKCLRGENTYQAHTTTVCLPDEEYEMEEDKRNVWTIDDDKERWKECLIWNRMFIQEGALGFYFSFDEHLESLCDVTVNFVVMRRLLFPVRHSKSSNQRSVCVLSQECLEWTANCCQQNVNDLQMNHSSRGQWKQNKWSLTPAADYKHNMNSSGLFY